MAILGLFVVLGPFDFLPFFFWSTLWFRVRLRLLIVIALLFMGDPRFLQRLDFQGFEKDWKGHVRCLRCLLLPFVSLEWACWICWGLDFGIFRSSLVFHFFDTLVASLLLDDVTTRITEFLYEFSDHYP